MVKTKRKRSMAQSPIAPAASKETAKGNKKLISRSKIINSIATK
jgi:hypothetical protein